LRTFIDVVNELSPLSAVLLLAFSDMGDRTKANRLSWPPRIERRAASGNRSRHSHNGIAGEAAQKMAGTHGTGRKDCTPAEAIDVVAGVHGCKGAAASTMRLWTGLRGIA
jgi:hypothetical protein